MNGAGPAASRSSVLGSLLRLLPLLRGLHARERYEGITRARHPARFGQELHRGDICVFHICDMLHDRLNSTLREPWVVLGSGA